jgi:EpsD family peptidyl-prolyl cis-trans isomerase
LSANNLMIAASTRPFPSIGPFAVAALALAVTLAGCGEKKDKPATQTAAKVNKEEITVHQINMVTERQRALPAEQAASAASVVLERLIDQELALQKAADQKLDRDPRVMQAIEASRREIISRAYVEKIGEGAPKPTPAEVQAYYEKHPALFSSRRIYNLQEVEIEVPPEQLDALKAALASAKNFSAFLEYLKTNGIKFQGSEGVRSAEQLPLATVDQFAALKDGQAVFVRRPKGARVIHLVASRAQPVNLQAATPAIEQYLLNERKRKLIADDLQALRKSAKIEYVGDFATNRPPPPPESPQDDKPLIQLPSASGPAPVNAAPQVEVAPRDTSPASMPSGATLDKGLKGMK